MKFFKALAIVCLFFFLIGCEESIKKLGPEDEAHDAGSDVTDNDVVDTDVEPTDDGDSTEPTDDGDSTEPTEPTSDGDSTEPTNDEDSTDPTDDGDSTEPTNDEDSTEPTNDEDQVVVTPQEKCAAKNGTWESSSQRCYQIKNCEPDKPANSEWNGDSSYKIYYDADIEILEPLTYPPHYGDGEPEICQYKCIANHDYVNGECKPYCSAVFDGVNSYVEVPHHEVLNLAYDSWTIEAWFKQAPDEVPTINNNEILPILGKGTTGSQVYLLSEYYNKNEKSHVGYFVQFWGKSQYAQQGTNTYIYSEPEVTYSSDWTHIAMVQNKKTTQGQGGWGTTTTYTLSVFVNGEQVKSENYKVKSGYQTQDANQVTILTNEESLVIGADLANEPKLYFKGLIDSIRISDTARYTEGFEPTKLYYEDDEDDDEDNNHTVAFWDFNGNAEEASNPELNGTGTVTYSTDCVQ